MRYIFVLLLIPLCGCQSSSKKAGDQSAAPQIINEPKLTKPAAHRIWIADKIEDDGKTLEAAHWRYILDKESSWTR